MYGQEAVFESSFDLDMLSSELNARNFIFSKHSADTQYTCLTYISQLPRWGATPAI
jgi:hypothetical protein